MHRIDITLSRSEIAFANRTVLSVRAYGYPMCPKSRSEPVQLGPQYRIQRISCRDISASAEPLVLCCTGVVSNNSQCQITRICAIARARSRSLLRRCLFISSVRVMVRVRCNNSHLSRKSRTASYLAMRHILHDTTAEIVARLLEMISK